MLCYEHKQDACACVEAQVKTHEQARPGKPSGKKGRQPPKKTQEGPRTNPPDQEKSTGSRGTRSEGTTKKAKSASRRTTDNTKEIPDEGKLEEAALARCTTELKERTYTAIGERDFQGDKEVKRVVEFMQQAAVFLTSKEAEELYAVIATTQKDGPWLHDYIAGPTHQYDVEAMWRDHETWKSSSNTDVKKAFQALEESIGKRFPGYTTEYSSVGAVLDELQRCVRYIERACFPAIAAATETTRDDIRSGRSHKMLKQYPPAASEMSLLPAGGAQPLHMDSMVVQWVVNISFNVSTKSMGYPWRGHSSPRVSTTDVRIREPRAFSRVRDADWRSDEDNWWKLPREDPTSIDGRLAVSVFATDRVHGGPAPNGNSKCTRVTLFCPVYMSPENDQEPENYQGRGTQVWESTAILHYLEGTREPEQVERAHTRLQQDIHALGGTTWLESDLAKSGYGETLLQELRDICAKPTEAMAKWVSTDEAEAARAFYKPTVRDAKASE